MKRAALNALVVYLAVGCVLAFFTDAATHHGPNLFDRVALFVTVAVGWLPGLIVANAF